MTWSKKRIEGEERQTNTQTCDKLTLRVSLQSHYGTNEHSCDARGGCHVPGISEEGSILFSITPPET